MAPSFPESADSILDSTKLGTNVAGKSSETSSADPFSQSIGQPSPASPTSKTSRLMERSELISSAEDSRVSRFPAPDLDSDNRTNGTCGPKQSESFANFNPDTCSWKTSQGFLLTTISEPSLQTWPTAGTACRGTAYRRPPLVPRTSVSGFGYLPTPDASLGTRYGLTGDLSVGFQKMATGTRKSGAKIGSSLRWCPEFVRETLRTGGYLNPAWLEVLMGFPISWTDAEYSETPSFPQSRSGSEGD